MEVQLDDFDDVSTTINEINSTLNEASLHYISPTGNQGIVSENNF